MCRFCTASAKKTLIFLSVTRIYFSINQTLP